MRAVSSVSRASRADSRSAIGRRTDSVVSSSDRAAVMVFNCCNMSMRPDSSADCWRFSSACADAVCAASALRPDTSSDCASSRADCASSSSARASSSSAAASSIRRLTASARRSFTAAIMSSSMTTCTCRVMAPTAFTLATPVTPSSRGISVSSVKSVSSVLSMPSIATAATSTGRSEGLILSTYGVPTVSSHPPCRAAMLCWMSTPIESMFTLSSNSRMTTE